jgi:hypothetical protein
MLYQGSQKVTRRAKAAGPTTRFFAVSAFKRCRDFPARLSAGRGMTCGGRVLWALRCAYARIVVPIGSARR